VGGGGRRWEAVGGGGRRWLEPVLSLFDIGELDKNSLEAACDEEGREKGLG
jgi:hypothetical protein